MEKDNACWFAGTVSKVISAGYNRKWRGLNEKHGLEWGETRRLHFVMAAFRTRDGIWVGGIVVSLLIRSRTIETTSGKGITVPGVDRGNGFQGLR